VAGTRVKSERDIAKALVLRIKALAIMAPVLRVSETRFVRACRGEVVDRVPVWLMRQAGRYLPEYQALRRTASFWDLCSQPNLAARATLDAARYLGTDAAIIFSDITLPAWAMGQQLDFSPGPVLSPAVRTISDVAQLNDVKPEAELRFVLDAIRMTRRELNPEVSLIGFVGAPLTVAAYMVEGKPSRTWHEFKRVAYGDPDVLHALLERVTPVVASHAAAQIRAGCDAVQLFDSLAGELAATEVADLAFVCAAKVVSAVAPLGAPVIYFARNIGAHLQQAAKIGADVLGLDWTVSVAQARSRLGDDVGLMGNLDPAVLLTNPEEIDRRVRAILDEADGHHSFVFNLGHGVLPGTPPLHARQVVTSVRQWSQSNKS
jgi:uroporphyrinogen decarboxylase